MADTEKNEILHGCMFDTVAFNRILEGVIPLEALTGVIAYATHIQRDEINNTKNPERRTENHGNDAAESGAKRQRHQLIELSAPSTFALRATADRSAALAY